ncbi:MULTISPECIES: hypothetical protein [Staphylococcus]|uniref:hypothetical protein n=1 Tax=Staphylococcus TaxID=1279 RepID=UPI000C7D3A1C|nr:hypothetical protein [Staphylococcus hominis]MDI0074332.1 hypothetical protein [Staphylococcus epidermidis]MCI2894649.1 hypothetical protein [Staphylococcus hominis]MCI2898181.1 hypothetical protein [Staphylococcus hominis]MCI2903030.1 hypothetical protein [Staphylococcus hominis]MCI2905569.1 hypothetical protein [Staphylococcus hominis]
MFQKFITYIKLSRINAYRKEASDWGINLYLWPKIRLILNFIFPLFIALISFGVSILLKRDNSITNTVTFILFVLILSQSLFFFSKKKQIFLEDDLRVFNKSSEFRFIRIISEIFFSIMTQIVYYYISILTPIYLMEKHSGQVFILFKICILFTLISLVSTLLFSFLQFIFHKYTSNLKVLKTTSILRYILFIISLFVLSYFITTIFINNTIANKIIFIFNSSKVFDLTNKTIYLLIDNFLLSVLFLLLFSVLQIIIFKKYLNRKKLITYSRLISNVNNNYSNHMLHFRKIFLLKDFIHFQRLSGWIISYIIKSLCITFIISGIIIPIVVKLWGGSLWAYSSIAIILSTIVYQLIGDSLKIILSVDAEKNHIYLLPSKQVNLWNFVKDKWILYCVISLLITSLLGGISIIYSHNMTVFLSTIITSFSYGCVSGLIQISSTAIYPKLNWEYTYEIGESKKASSFNDYISQIITVLYFSTLLLLIIPEKLNLKIDETILLLAAVVIQCLISIIISVITILFLKKKTIKESFNYDK